MKSLITVLKSMLVFFIVNSISFWATAQEKKVDVDINVGKGNSHQWYMSPVAWVIGAAIFILILVALLRGRSKN